MPDISVPWGQDELTFAIPESWTIQQTATPSLRPASSDWREHLARALDQPGTGLPLGKLLQARRGGRIVLIVEDVTRHSPIPELLEVVLKEIRHAGMDDERLEVVFATGMHPAMTPEQAGEKLGEPGRHLRWRSNPWQDPSRYVRVGKAGRLDVSVDRGVATADLRIILSSVSPHLQAGFGGGYKMLLPGCSALDTIRGLHRLGLSRRARQLVGTGVDANPMRATINAGGALVDAHHGRSFAVQYVLDDADLPAYIATGEVLPCQQMLAKQCSVACGIVTPATGDVLITNAHPRDHDLWQCFKCIPNTCWAARPNGVIICLARCEGGMEDLNPPPWPLSPAWTRRVVRWLGPTGITSLLTRLVPRLAGDAAFFVQLALQAIHRNPIFMVSPALHASASKFPGLEVFGSPEEAVAAANRLLGGGPQRVVVFPSGGATFPIAPAIGPGGTLSP